MPNKTNKKLIYYQKVLSLNVQITKQKSTLTKNKRKIKLKTKKFKKELFFSYKIN